MNPIAESTKLTESGTFFTGTGYFVGFLVGTDGVNDPTITIYDGIDNTGEEFVPTNQYDASLLGINGAMFPFLKVCSVGAYCEISCAGAVEVTGFWRSR